MTSPPAPSVRYTIEEADPDVAGEDVLRLWTENLGTRGSGGPSKLAWFYRAAPAARGRLLLLRAHHVVGAPLRGCQGIGYRRVAFEGRMLQAALLADLAVDPRDRTLFPALALVRQARAVAAETAELQLGFPNRAAAGVFQRAGYGLLGRIQRHARVLRYERYVARRVRLPFLARWSGAALDLADAVRCVVPRLRAAAGHRLERLTAPDARFDALFEEAHRTYRLLGDRRAQALRWRFFERGPGPELFALVRGRDGAVRAYAVVIRDGDVAHLADFLGAGDAELDALLALLLPALRARGCSSASARFLGAARIPRVLAGRGFRPREAERAVMIAAERGPLAARLENTRAVEAFYLTDADEDE